MFDVKIVQLMEAFGFTCGYNRHRAAVAGMDEVAWVDVAAEEVAVR